MELTNFELEKLILGTLIDSSESILQLELKEDDFNTPKHKQLFSCLRKLTISEKPRDIEMLKQEGLKAFELFEIKEHAVLSDIKHHIKELKSLTFKRRLKRYGIQLQEIAESADTDIDIDVLYEKSMALGEELKEDIIEKNQLDGYELVKIYEQEQELLAQGQMVGLSTEFKDLDNITKGFKGGQLIVVAGRPKMGKSILVANFAKSTFQKGLGVLFFSFELRGDELARRFISMLSGIPHSKIEKGYQFDEIEKAKKHLFTDLLSVVTGRSFSLGELRVRAKAVKKEMQSKGNNLSLVIVDLLTHVTSDRKETREQEVSHISRGLKVLAQELDIPIVAVSQLNRGLEHRPDPRPRISDLRESGAIEQDADKILLLYRPEYYDSQIPLDELTADQRVRHEKNAGICEVNIAAQRQGDNGIIKLQFDGECTRFRPLHRGE